MDSSFNKKEIENVVIPRSRNFTKSSVDIANLSSEGSDEIMKKYMKNVKTNSKCSKPRFTNNFLSKTTIESIERQKLLQIVKLNELKHILIKLSIMEKLKEV
tara:strand:+ start:78 stop:383 length:306 start_codon:yes stop_codon:yes gene_type:complete